MRYYFNHEIISNFVSKFVMKERSYKSLNSIHKNGEYYSVIWKFRQYIELQWGDGSRMGKIS